MVHRWHIWHVICTKGGGMFRRPPPSDLHGGYKSHITHDTAVPLKNHFSHTCDTICKTVPLTDDHSQMTRLSCNSSNRGRHIDGSSSSVSYKAAIIHTVYTLKNSSLDRWSFTDDTSVMKYLQQFPRLMIVHRRRVCKAIFTTVPSTDDPWQMTRLSCHIYNSSLDRWSLTDDTSVMQYLQQLPRQMIVHRRHVCNAIFTTLPSTDDRWHMTCLSSTIYSSSLDRWSLTDDTSVMQYLQQFPWQMIFHRSHICHAIFTTVPSTDERSQMTRLSCNIYHTSLDRWSLTDDTSVMQYLQQFPRQMIVHRWHIYHGVFTTGGGRLRRPP